MSTRWQTRVGLVAVLAWMAAGAQAVSREADLQAECRADLRQASACHGVPREGLLAVLSPGLRPGDDRWGFVDARGHMAIAPAYSRVGDFAQGLAAAEQGERWGFIDKLGQWVIEPQFTRVLEFDASGWAWVERDGRLWRLNRQGATQPVASEALLMSLVSDRRLPDGRVRAELTPRPQLWSLADGAAQALPDALGAVAAPRDGLIPAAVQLPSWVKRWGLMTPAGQWAAPPATLQSDEPPLHHAGVVAVARSGRWHLVDLQGQPLLAPSYERVQWLAPGVWVVTAGGDQPSQWLDARLRSLHQVPGSHLASYRPEALAGGWFFENADHWVWVTAQGRVLGGEAEGLTLHTRRRQLWLLPSSDAPAGRDARPEVLGADGRSLLDTATREALRGYHLEIVPDPADGEAADADAPQALAVLTPKAKAGAAGRAALLTAQGRIVTGPDWLSVRPGSTPSDPWVVQTAAGLFGAVDAQGRWVIAPTWAGLQPFRQGVSWARAVGSARRVLLRAQGEGVVAPEAVALQCAHWLGRWLDCQDLQGPKPRRWLFEPRQGRVLDLPELNGLEAGRGDWLLARRGERWGVIDGQGQWRVPPLAAEAHDLTWLDDEVLVVRRAEPAGHALWSPGRGEALSGWQKEVPDRLAKSRYLVADGRGGQQLIDGAGRVLLHTPWGELSLERSPTHLWLTPYPQDGWLSPEGRFETNKWLAATGRLDETEANELPVPPAPAWPLRLSLRCGQLVVRNAQGAQTWPTAALRCAAGGRP